MKKTSRFTKFVSAGLTTVMLLFAVSTMNSVQVFAATTGTVNVSALNLRSGASTQTSVVSVLSSGTSVQIEGTQGDWYKVTVSVSGATKSGYVYSKYITAGQSQTTTDTTVNATGVVNTSALNVRKGPSTSTARLGTIGLGTKVNVIGTSGTEWYQVSLTLNGQTVTAYVYKSYITLTDNNSNNTNNDNNSTSSSDQTTSASGQGVVNTSYGLNVRSSASTSSSILGCLSKNATVQITGQSGTWYQVIATVNGKTVTGYVAAAYITKTEGASDSNSGSNDTTAGDTTTYTKGKVTCVALNLRSQASTASAVLTVLYQNTYLTIESESNGWYKVSTTSNGKTVSGYVSADYVQKVSDDEANDATNTSSVIAATADEEPLLAAVVYCEAGNQSYEGQLAVANVVINRVKSSLFPNTIKEVIFAPGQFMPATSPRLNAALQNGVPASCTQAAKDAIAGNNNVEGFYFFLSGPFNVPNVAETLVIGDHTFYHY